MTRKNWDFEFPDDMSEDDTSKFINSLECYVTDMPSDDEINNTIEHLRNFVPYKRSKRKYIKILDLFRRALREIRFMSSSYWLVSSMLFILGAYSIWMNEGSITNIKNPYISAVILAPVPFILGIIEIFRGREEGIIELELSCKLSIGEIMFSRLIIICIYNMFLNTAMSMVLMCFNRGIMFWRITLMWLTPFTVMSGIALMFVSRIRGSYVTGMFTGVWVVFIMSLLTQKKIMDRIVNINLVFYGVITAIGILLMIIQIKNYSRRESSFFKRSVLGEAKN